MIGAVLICAVLSWSDGDSGRCDGRRFRLHGIDAAEAAPQTRCRAQPTIWACRPENRRHAAPAGARARHLTRNGAQCIVTDLDRYGRLVVRCAVGDRDLGAQLVSEGMVIADPTFGASYMDEQALAQRYRLGIWE
jgi:endonuclease YncB( thermonuclease family)